MKNFIKILGLFFMLFAIAFPTSCSSDNSTEPSTIATPDPTPEPLPTPIVSDISPTSGPKTTIVTINGEDFGTDGNLVAVFFNDVEAQVQSVENDKIIAQVPVRAFTGVVTIVINGTTLIGPVFTYVISDVQVSTLAGSTSGYADGTGANAQFSFPRGAAVILLGVLFVTDQNRIRALNVFNGDTGTLAGSSTDGFADGTGANAQFNAPYGVAVDAQGNVYVADTSNHSIRIITPNGDVSTLAGGTQGSADGIGANAQFNYTNAVATDMEGNVYVADINNHRIRKITPSGEVSTLAGSSQGFADGLGTNAQFSSPLGVAVDLEGNVYVADKFNYRIRKITPSGEVSTLAGSTPGFADGTGPNAMFNSPNGVAVDLKGNVYVTDDSRIRKITPSGDVSTLAGSTDGFADGTGANAQFNAPYGVAVDADKNIYVVDTFNNKIRKITQE